MAKKDDADRLIDVDDCDIVEGDPCSGAPCTDVVDQVVELAFQHTPEYPTHLRHQLRQVINGLDGKFDLNDRGPQTLGEVVEFAFASVAWSKPDLYPTLIKDALNGLEYLVGLEEFG